MSSVTSSPSAKISNNDQEERQRLLVRVDSARDLMMTSEILSRSFASRTVTVEPSEYCNVVCCLLVEFLVDEEGNYHQKPKREAQGKNSAFITGLLVIYYMMGSSILVQPYTFKESGIVAALVAYVLAVLASHTGVYLLIKTGEYTGAISYNDVACEAFGPVWGSLISDIAFVWELIGSLLVFMLLIASLVAGIVATYVSDDTIADGDWYYNSALLMGSTVLVCVLPMCFVRDFAALGFVSFFSTAVSKQASKQASEANQYIIHLTK
jgi:Transmembrane amino acid transporter protein